MAGSTGSIRAGRAFVELFADSSQLSKGLKAASDQIKGFGEGIAAVGAGIAATGGAALAFFGGALKTFAETGSQLKELSDRTGLSVESLSQFGYAAEQSGSSLDGFTTGIRMMQRGIAQAENGTGKAAEALATLGISLDEIKDADPNEQFQILGKSIAAVEDPTKRTALAMALFGRGGVQLLPMIEHMDELTGRANELGIVLGRDDAEAAHELSKAFHDVEVTVKAVVVQIGAALAPAVTDLAVNLANAITYVIAFVKQNREVIVLAAEIAAGLVAVGGVIAGIGIAIIGLGAVIGGFTTVVTAILTVIGGLWAAIMTPGLVVAAVVIGVGAAFLYTSGIAGKALQYIADQFSGLLVTATEAWQGIKDAMAGGNLELAARIAWLGVKTAVLENTQGLQTAIINLVADVKFAWTALTFYLEKTWADWVNASIHELKIWGITVAKIMAAAGLAASSSQLLFMSTHLMKAEGPDVGDFAGQLVEIEQARQGNLKGAAGLAEEARFDFNAARARAAAEAAQAVQQQADAAEKIAAGAKAAAKLTDTAERGTFNPFAAGALAGSDKMSGIEKNTKKGAKHLENIERKLDDLDELGP